MMKRAAATILVAFAVTMTACQKPPAPPPAGPPKVVVTTVLQKDEPIYREWIGTTQGNVNAEIRPKVDGYLLRRVYTEGSFVHQGDLLFEIDPRQVQAQLQQAQANLEEANAGLAKAEHDVSRFEPLAAEKAISQQELDNARSALRASKAAVGSAQAAVDQARLNLSWTKVFSPISGIAGLAQQQVGNLVSPQAVLTIVSQVDPIRVLYQVSEQDYLRFQKDPAMKNASLELVLSDGSAFAQKGHLLLSGREVDVKTGTITTVGLFPNPGNVLRPGEYAKVRAVVEVKRNAILVPQRAVNELQGTYQVGVVGSDGKADIRKVAIGERIGSLWIIDAGLEPGDRVIVEGFSRVKAGTAVIASDAPAGSADSATPAGEK
jgi:membrane fusion protein (multidrug efflux system)